MKNKPLMAIVTSLLLIISGCTAQTPTEENNQTTPSSQTTIELSDEEILVNGETISEDETSAVYAAHDLIYYEEGTDDSYGEGDSSDMHSAEEAAKHTVIHINEPGDYTLSGSLSYGQILIDLGEDAQDDPNAVVNLTLNNVDLTATASSAIVVLNAYECADEEAGKAVDTSDAGFNLILADNSINTINGSHVAKIYEEGTTDKKYKFDGAIESLVSLNISGSGQLDLNADNEGIETKYHMTINGGIINIQSGDDALNASEDDQSVITINDGTITCSSVNGTEGDGIDSNGWIVINGGTVIAYANPTSMDSGFDSDNGIYINGGTVYGAGNMYDEIAEESTQAVAVLNNRDLHAGDIIVIKDNNDEVITAFELSTDYSVIVYSTPEMEEEVHFYKAETIEGEQEGAFYTTIENLEVGEELTNDETGRGPGGPRPQGEPGSDQEPPKDHPQKPEGEEPPLPKDEPQDSPENSETGSTGKSIAA